MVQRLVNDRPGEYDQATIANIQDLLQMLEKTGRPAPQIGAGYWPTFRVTWSTVEAAIIEIELFSDRFEIYRFYERRTAIWNEAHTAGQAFTPAFFAELPVGQIPN